MALILVADSIGYVEERKSSDKKKLLVYAQAVGKGELYKLMAFADGKTGDPDNPPLLLEQLRNLEKTACPNSPARLEVSILSGGGLWIKKVVTDGNRNSVTRNS